MDLLLPAGGVVVVVVAMLLAIPSVRSKLRFKSSTDEDDYRLVPMTETRSVADKELEIKIVQFLRGIGPRGTSTKHIARRVHKPVHEIRPVLADMTRRNLIIRSRRRSWGRSSIPRYAVV